MEEEALQIAVVDHLLAAAAVTGIVALSDDGPAVFAGSVFEDVFPRLTLDAVQLVPLGRGCVESYEAYVTLHCWARGTDDAPDAPLVAQRLSGAVRNAFKSPVTSDAVRIKSQRWDGARPAGDPDNLVEHLVVTMRFVIQPAA